MESAGLAEQIDAGTQIEVIGVGEDDGGIERLDLFNAERFNRAVGADGHKDGRLDIAVLRVDNAASGFAAFFEQSVGNGAFLHDVTFEMAKKIPP